MKTIRTLALLLCCTNLARAEMPQLDTKFEGDTVILSGVVDAWRDRSKLWNAIRGKRAVIFRDLRAESLDSGLMLAKVVKQARTTTVLDGDCDETCMPMFLGGFTRQWMLRPGMPPASATLANRPRPMGQTVNSNTIQDAAAYSYYAQQFIAMPTSVLQTYIMARVPKNGVLFIQPSAAKPDGEGLQCEDVTRRDLCLPNENLKPLTVGLVTTLEPFSLAATGSATPASVRTQPEPVAPQPANATPAPGRPASQVNAGAVLTARNVNAEDGPTNIGSSFNQEGRIFAYVSFSWPVDMQGGSHTFETLWYRGGQLVHRSAPETVSWKATPGAASYAVRAAELGAGSYRVEALLDGRHVGSKDFTIRAD